MQEYFWYIFIIYILYNHLYEIGIILLNSNLINKKKFHPQKKK